MTTFKTRDTSHDKTFEDAVTALDVFIAMSDYPFDDCDNIKEIKVSEKLGTRLGMFVAVRYFPELKIDIGENYSFFQYGGVKVWWTNGDVR